MMKTLPLILVLLLVGWASCACKLEDGKKFKTVDGCATSRIYRPVCGSDGCSYVNDDSLACAQKSNRDLRLAYKGECRMGEEEVEGNVAR